MHASKTFSPKQKIAAAPTRTQLILLDENGGILESDDLIFSTQNFGEKSVIARFPFFENVWSSIVFSEKNLSETTFKAVQFAEIELPGIYDFNFFVKISEKKLVVLWTISDETAHYLMRQKRQQMQADRILRLQKRALAQ